MQSVRSGFILNLGLVTIPVDLHSVIPSNKRGAGTRVLCQEHMTPIRQVYQCPTDDQLKPDTVKGIEVTKGKYAIPEDEDTILASEGIELVAVPTADLNEATITGDKLYYLSPPTSSLQAWEVLFRLARDKKRTLIGQTAIRKNSRKIYRLTTFNDYLVLQNIEFPEHVREAPPIVHPTVSKAMMAQARKVLEATEIPWEKFDAEDEGLKQFRARLEGAVPVTTDDEPETDNVVDLMEALTATLESTKKGA